MTKTLRYAFRITHIDNIPYIDRNGLVKADSPLRNPNYVSIGDTQVIQIRNQRIFKGYRLSDFIPFYLGPRSPMLYVIQHGYNGVKRVDAEQIVYCVIRLDDINNYNIDCVFTDGHALSALTTYYEKKDLGRIDKIVNYDDVYSSQWNLEEDLDLKRRKEAELLVRVDLPPRFTRGYVVYNDNAKQRLINSNIDAAKIVIAPGYYF